ncbi:hypothetical protein [Streptococcus cuniculi]|uniref:hypothetical protein n=1 Tax=Streptococcus cuniculi TaxID=1432788 RepID=UPI0014320854|nr:hypothetical protein [Streptococcus cuniculi]MBF0777564.1 hypothetical protein [Streptococcus cuniculi]
MSRNDVLSPKNADLVNKVIDREQLDKDFFRPTRLSQIFDKDEATSIRPYRSLVSIR